MDRNGLYLQLYARAPAPCRDYYGLTISEKEIILNIWNITYGPHVYPKRHRCNLDEFPTYTSLQREVHQLFGNHVLEFCIHLSNNDRRLQCVPTKIFLYILRYLATNDILRLGQTSKIFFELCNRESTWKLIFGKRNKITPNSADMMKANESGWRHTLLKKIIPTGIIPIKVSTTKDINQKVQKKVKTPVTFDAKVKVINENTRQFKSLAALKFNKDSSKSHTLLNINSTHDIYSTTPQHSKSVNVTSRSQSVSTSKTSAKSKESSIRSNPFVIPNDIMNMITKHNVNISNKSTNVSNSSLNNSKKNSANKIELHLLKKSAFIKTKPPAVNMIKNVLDKSSTSVKDNNSKHGIKLKK